MVRRLGIGRVDYFAAQLGMARTEHFESLAVELAGGPDRATAAAAALCVGARPYAKYQHCDANHERGGQPPLPP